VGWIQVYRVLLPKATTPLPSILYQHSMTHSSHSAAPSLSHYQFNHWLLALLQLLQNTTWDRWQYWNGIIIILEDALLPFPETLPLCNLSLLPSSISSQSVSSLVQTRWCLMTLGSTAMVSYYTVPEVLSLGVPYKHAWFPFSLQALTLMRSGSNRLHHQTWLV